MAARNPFRRILRASFYTSAANPVERRGLTKDLPLKWFDVPSKTTIERPKGQSSKRRGPEGEEARKAYERLRMNGIKPSIPLALAALKSCTFRSELLKIYDELIKSKDDKDTAVSNTLIDMFSKCSGLVDARKIFDGMGSKRDIISWNTMIKSYVQNSRPQEALELFSKIRDDGLLPNGRTYLAALNACTALAATEEAEEIDGRPMKEVSLGIGRKIHSQLVKSQHDADIFVESALVDLYAKCGSVEEARKIFDAMEHHDLVSWTAIILGYSNSGRCELALELFTRMKEEGFIPDSRAFVGALSACSSLAMKEPWKTTMEGKLIRPVSLARGRSLHAEMEKIRVKLDGFVESSLVDMYCKSGSVEDARRVFDRMFRHDVVSWTSIISGYAECGDGEQALQLFAKMQEVGVRPDCRTYVAALGGCSSLAEKQGKNVEREFVRSLALSKGKAIHAQVCRTGLEIGNVFVGNALVDMYGKCGSMKDAEEVICRMEKRDTISWNSLIAGYVLNEEGGEGLKVFWRMQQEGVKVNASTLAAVVKACGSLGDLGRGRRVEAEVVKAMGLDKDSRVASALVEMYEKCGSVVDAQRVFDCVEAGDLDFAVSGGL